MFSSQRAARPRAVDSASAFSGEPPTARFRALTPDVRCSARGSGVFSSTCVKASIASREGSCSRWIPLPCSGRMQLSAVGWSAQFCVSASRMYATPRR